MNKDIACAAGNEVYHGFEQGPIRPPSEADSLLLRVTRNCPWNQCKFCPVYKGTEFSVRPKEHVKRDIDAVYEAVQHLQLRGAMASSQTAVREDRAAWAAAWHWVRCGMRQVFLQDANSLVIDPGDLADILRHLKGRFPEIKRVTSYARSTTVARIEDEALAALREAGLNRIHIGLESGADAVLKMVHKGTTKKRQIIAGQKVKKAGMELSEYYLPGLGGRRCWRENALETASALNEINPDFIRIRTLAIPYHIPLYDDLASGRFEKGTDVEMAEELALFLESLHGITSVLKSDHILNLLPEVDGKLPEDRDRMLGVVRAFLDLDPPRQFLYRVGRRACIFSRLSDLENSFRLSQVEEICRSHQIGPENVDRVTDDLMRQFI